MARKLSYEEVKEYIESKGCILKSKEYKGGKNKILIQCPKGHDWETRLDTFKSGKGCPYCSGKKLTYIFVKNYIENEGYRLLSKEFKKSKEKLNMCCDKGHEFNMNFDNFKQGQRCPICYLSSKKLDYSYVKENIEIDGYKLLSKEYLGGKNKLEMECPKGHKFNMRFDQFQQGKRCPHCNESKGEKKISEYLSSNNITYIAQYRYEDCKDKITLPFDFYLPDYNTCIEYDGEQHFKPQDFAGKGEEWATNNMLETQRRDRIKTQYCKNNNIKLIRISYLEFDNIESILKNNLTI